VTELTAAAMGRGAVVTVAVTVWAPAANGNRAPINEEARAMTAKNADFL